MCHEIQTEDETHSKKSGSSTIKSRSRVKSMSKHDQFIRITHFLLAINSGLGVKSGWRLDILFSLGILFIVLETDFLLYVLSSAWISWYIFSTLFYYFSANKKYLYSVLYEKIHIIKWNINLNLRNIANLKLRNTRASQSRFSSQREQTLSTCDWIIFLLLETPCPSVGWLVRHVFYPI